MSFFRRMFRLQNHQYSFSQVPRVIIIIFFFSLPIHYISLLHKNNCYPPLERASNLLRKNAFAVAMRLWVSFPTFTWLSDSGTLVVDGVFVKTMGGETGILGKRESVMFLTSAQCFIALMFAVVGQREEDIADLSVSVTFSLLLQNDGVVAPPVRPVRLRGEHTTQPQRGGGGLFYGHVHIYYSLLYDLPQ